MDSTFDFDDIDLMSLNVDDADISVFDWGGMDDDAMLEAALVTIPPPPVATVTNITETKPKPAARPAATEKPNDQFPRLTEEDLIALEDGRNEKSTKSSTNWGVRRFKEWCTQRGLSPDFEALPVKELSDNLRQFYGEVRKKDGADYSKNALCGLRSAIHRHITSAPFNRKINIMRDSDFRSANNVLIGTLKANKRAGKDTTTCFAKLSPEDMKRLMSSGVFSLDDPQKLQDWVWFALQFYLCRRGCEGVRELKKDSFEFLQDGDGVEYVQLKYNESSKNHPGGFQETHDPKRKMFSTGGDLCPVNALKLYIQRLHPDCDALYQRPNTVQLQDNGWYAPLHLGVRKLGGMMSRISLKAGLSKRYTNHCLRATCIATLMQSGFDPITVTRLSGHRNVASVMSYCRDATDQVKRQMGSSLTSSLTGNGLRSIPSSATAPALPTSAAASAMAPLPMSNAMPMIPAPQPSPAYSCSNILQEIPKQSNQINVQSNSSNALSTIFSNCTVTIGSLTVGK